MPVNWFDFAVLAFLTWGAVNGYFRGVTLSLINILAWFSGVALAFYSKGPVAFFVNQQYEVNPLITRVLSQNMDLPMKVTGAPIPGEDLSAFIQRLPVGPFAKNSLWEYFYREGEKIIYQGGSPAEFLYSWMAEALIQIVCFGAVLAIIIALFKLAEGAWELKKQGKFLAEVSSLAGLLVGLLKSFFVLLVVAALIMPLLEVFDFILLEDIRSSFSANSIISLINTVGGRY